VTSECFNIAVFAGDGIGPEIVTPSLRLLDTAASVVGGFSFHYEMLEAGAELYRREGTSLPDEALRYAESADAVLLGAMGLPDIRYPDGTEISPQLDLREHFDLYAGVRPIKTLKGLPLPLRDPRASQLDLVLVRESTEGLFAARAKTVRVGDQVARDTMEITRPACERLFDFAFRLAERRRKEGFPGIVTCVDKANVLGAFAFFRKIFTERAALFPEVRADVSYVDAMGLNLVKRPWDFDVLVTENMFGDILSDVGAALMGGMGMAPSADIGDDHAVFQPCHGSAPDIVGRGWANPTAMFLSAAMMMDWLGERHNLQACRIGAKAVTRAVEATFADGYRLPFELGGKAGTHEIAAAVIEHLSTLT
jgi:3-isopropylmalate dehydrogenase